MARLAPLLALLLAGCSSPQATPAVGSDASGDAGLDAGGSCFFCGDARVDTDASLASQVQGVVDQICSNADGCHGQSSGGMSLSVGNEFSAMIGVLSTERPDLLRVRPGDPLQSYVYLKLWCDGGIDGGCMPKDAPEPSLAPLFFAWIEAGAPLP